MRSDAIQEQAIMKVERDLLARWVAELLSEKWAKPVHAELITASIRRRALLDLLAALPAGDHHGAS